MIKFLIAYGILLELKHKHISQSCIMCGNNLKYKEKDLFIYSSKITLNTSL